MDGVARSWSPREAAVTASSTNSDFRQLVEAAKAEGYTVKITHGGHWKFTPPDLSKGVFFASCSPNRPERFIRNVRRDLRSRGVRI